MRERDLTGGATPSVTVRERESTRARAVFAQAELGVGRSGSGLVCGPVSGCPLCSSFSFSFCAVYDICLKLCNKLIAGPKMMKIFV